MYLYVCVHVHLYLLHVYIYKNNKKHLKKNERVCRDIYQNRKSTGTRWLWQQNEIPLPHNNRT